MNTKKETSIKKEKIEVPLEWIVPENVGTPFATNMLVQRIENEFKLYFFETQPPPRFSNKEPIPNKIKAFCVGSVIVTADRLPKFIDALQKAFKQYQDSKKIT